MLFNSPVFLLAFLPAALLLHGAADRFAPQARLPVLVVLSFVFYASWDLRSVPLLAASIVLNWLVAEAFGRGRPALLVPVAIAANLLLLGLFKYLDFFGGLFDLLPGVALPRFDLLLPIGISFFTFQHVMYLSDLRAGRAGRGSLLQYAFYVAFFPRVLAGPLVRWAELIPQLAEPAGGRPDSAERFARGLLLLTAGLAKKVFLGDPLSESVNPVFAKAAAGGALTVSEAWQGTLGYTFQLYFDFSGYTDMALGTALLFGFALPENFDAPYRAASLQDFWRRWHMTLSRFLRDYLYIPFGGSRAGLPRQMLALVATMTLGGLWHGAGLTFVAWGLAHGLGLGAVVLWKRTGRTMPTALGAGLTFAFVALAWVLFRAPNFGAALAVYRALFGFAPLGEGLAWPMLAVAAAVATVGPTAHEAVRRVPPTRWAAAAGAVLFVLVLLRVGDDSNQDFLYVQF
jgi:D-alanyl-lipoteichoic acid acyltransferase DltB (MBOAT superfamily)